jgi:hypothetical protein
VPPRTGVIHLSHDQKILGFGQAEGDSAGTVVTNDPFVKIIV